MCKEISPIAAYRLWAASYDADHNPMTALAERTLDLGDLTGLDVVELGCGTGRNLEAMKGAGATSIAGCDLCPEMLAIAKKRLPEATLFTHDITTPTPLSRGEADLVLITLVLEHLLELEDVFAEARRLLADNGRLVVLELHPAAFAAGCRAKFMDDQGVACQTAAWKHERAEYQRVAKESGFSTGKFADIYPDAELIEHYPSARRRGLPWLIRAEWKTSCGQTRSS